MKATGFNKLDRSIGGLQEAGGYLVLGDTGSGRTTFCLGFARDGLERGERIAFITDRAPEDLLGQADSLGFDLGPYTEDESLLVFEYPENVAEMAAGLDDHRMLIDEFTGLLEGRRLDRLVFDPLTPLVRSGRDLDAQRCRLVMQSFAALRACSLFVLDVPGPSHVPMGCRAASSGILTLRGPGWSQPHHSMTLESFPEMAGARTIGFAIGPGAGLLEVREERPEPESAAPAPPPPAARFWPHPRPEPPATRTIAKPEAPLPLTPEPPHRPVLVEQGRARPETQKEHPGPALLIVEPDHTRRAMLRAQLEKNFTVFEAAGAGAAMSLAAAAAPKAILLAVEMTGIAGTETARMLRSRGSTALIVGLGDNFHRMRAQLEALASGVDLCLPYMEDERVLRLTLMNLLLRSGSVRRSELAGEAARISRQPECDGFAITGDLRAFCARIARETMYARDNGLPFLVLALRVPAIAQAVEELASTASMLLRLPDLVYTGPHGIACLLTEAASGEEFLNQFWVQWHGAVAPAVEELPYANQDAFLQRAREFVRTRVGIGDARPAAPLAPTQAVASASGDAARPFARRSSLRHD